MKVIQLAWEGLKRVETYKLSPDQTTLDTWYAQLSPEQLAELHEIYRAYERRRQRRDALLEQLGQRAS